jgi:hypothetical protein
MVCKASKWKAALALGLLTVVALACSPRMVAGNSSVGDLVWSDDNGNGLQDSGEQGVSDVTVWLLDKGGGIVQQTTTDGNGAYSFPEVEDGEYSLRFSAPAGMGFTLMDSGKDDELDSDVYQASGETEPFTLTESADKSRDAGLVGEMPEPTEAPPPATPTEAQPATPVPAATPAQISTTYEHTAPGQYSEIIVQIDNLTPGQEVSGVATGPAAGSVDGDGTFSATADDYGTAVARVKIFQFGDYLVTLPDLDLSSTVTVTAQEPASG